VTSEDVNEFLARRDRPDILGMLLLLRVGLTQKRGFPNDFKGIPDVQVRQAISQSGMGQTQKFHRVIAPAGRV
jgi:hypothetical protein